VYLKLQLYFFSNKKMESREEIRWINLITINIIAHLFVNIFSFYDIMPRRACLNDKYWLDLVSRKSGKRRGGGLYLRENDVAIHVKRSKREGSVGSRMNSYYTLQINFNVWQKSVQRTVCAIQSPNCRIEKLLHSDMQYHIAFYTDLFILCQWTLIYK